MSEAVKGNELTNEPIDEAGIAIPYPQRDVHLYEHSAENKAA